MIGAVSGVLRTAERLPSAVTRTRNGPSSILVVGTVGPGPENRLAPTAAAAAAATAATSPSDS